MNEDRALKTQAYAQIKLGKMMQLEFAGAICSDYKLEYQERFTLEETYKFFDSIGIKESIWISNLIRHYVQTTEYKKIIIPEEIWDISPAICFELTEWGFAQPSEQSGKYKEINSEMNIETFVSTGEVGFSFGSNTHLFRFLIPQMMTSDNLRYIIYEYCTTLSTFPELPKLLNKRFDAIIVRNIDSYKLNADDLIECHISGKTKRMNTTMQKLFSEMCGVEYSNLHYMGPKKINDSHYPKNLNIYMARKASAIIYNKIKEDLPTRILNRCDINRTKTVLVVTRDSVWAGPGQTSRELKIKDLEETIYALTELNFNVLRLNLYGENAEFSYDGFIDMASAKFDQLDQLAIIGKANFIIGADTGLTGFAQIASTIPTLAVGHPDIYPHSPWGEVVMMSRPLEIIDKNMMCSLSKEELKKNLFAINTQWDYRKLQNLGLTSKKISPTKIKEEALNFISRIENMELSRYKTTDNLGLNSIISCNIMLSDFTYKNLKGILDQTTNLQS